MKYKKVIYVSGGFLLALTVFIGVFWFRLMQYADKPASNEARSAVFVVKPGQPFQEISKRLHQEGFITDAFRFKLLVRQKGYDTQLKAGEYMLAANMTPNQILELLIQGKVKLHRVTIPEGYTIKQIAVLVEHAGLVSAEAFIAAAFDPDLLNRLNIDAQSVEGYLFPDTYYFPIETTPEDIIYTMVKRFWNVYKAEWIERTKSLGYSVQQIVTLASIIEKETGAASERPIISSVFHNRLKKRMRLESDPTVIYGIKNFDGNIKKKHLKMMTPYNTYKIRGLPQGPIANPGAKALEAALYPADTHYLYFVSKKDSTHHFSKTLSEHNRAVRKYQLRRRRK